jgi:hypothetical protein
MAHVRSTQAPSTSPQVRESRLHATFTAQASAAGFAVTHYEGRDYYSGPAVDCSSHGELLRLVRATTMRIETDELGKSGFVAYPR